MLFLDQILRRTFVINLFCSWAIKSFSRLAPGGGGGGVKIGGCFIRTVQADDGVEEHYVNTNTVGSEGHRGWPRNIKDEGSGLVHNSARKTCSYTSTEFGTWTMQDRQEMCTSSVVTNAARQLRHAIRNGQCGMDSLCQLHSHQVVSGMCKALLLSLPIGALYPLGRANFVGGCRIQRNAGAGFCDLYVKSATTGARGYIGWPRSTQDLGTGCVKAPNFPKRRGHCWYTGSDYNNWPMADRVKMCSSSDGKINAAEQLRHAILHDQCNLSC